MSMIASDQQREPSDTFYAKQIFTMNGTTRGASPRLVPLETAAAPNGNAMSPVGHSAKSTESTPLSPMPDLTNDTLVASGTTQVTSVPSSKANDISLAVPSIPTVHRLSSPPRLTTHSHTQSPSAHDFFSDTSLGPNAPRIQHRHTLEVPRPAPRLSGDHAAPSSAASDESSFNLANGRLSPTVRRNRRASLNLGGRISRSMYSDQHLDESQRDEEVAKLSEAYRQRRMSRRKRKEEEDDDRVIVGTKVDQSHVNWVTSYNMLTGIRFTVSRTNAKMDRKLVDADFQARHKFSFDITGNELTPSAKYDFKFKDYAPWVFRHLRQIFRLDPADYLMSLTSKYILSELGSPGKSGSFFYFSRDYKFIIKTIHHGEHRFLRKILRQYYEHATSNPDTLLSQFYGLHRVKIPYGRKIHFVVMNNLFPPHRDIHRTFDLKGSTIGRDYREEDIEKHPRATLKDLNWLRRDQHLELGPTKKHAFLLQMERDVELLKQLKIMDYSLLVGIHDLEKGNEENLRDKTLQVFQPGGENDESQLLNTLLRTPSKLEHAKKAKELRQTLKRERPVPMERSNSKMPDEMPNDMHAERKKFYFYSDDGGFRATHEDDSPGEEVYYLGIIDCLTKYNLVKRSEHFFKSLTNTESEISAIPPERYGKRFVNFMSSITVPRECTTEKTSSQRQSQDVPDRMRTTVESTGPDGATLPVVEEQSETISVGGRSGKSGRADEKEMERSRSRPQEESQPQGDPNPQLLRAN